MGQLVIRGTQEDGNLRLPPSLKRLADRGFLKACFTRDEFRELLSRSGKDLLLQKP